MAVARGVENSAGSDSNNPNRIHPTALGAVIIFRGPGVNRLGGGSEAILIERALHWFCALVVVTVALTPVRCEVVTLAPSKDNTLYEDPQGRNSNGAGPGIFAGTSGQGQIQRALIAFNFGQIPAGSTVEAVTLTLFQSNNRADLTEEVVQLHRVERDWGEGGSNAGGGGGSGVPATAGDATWVHTFFPNATWANPGGDFEAMVSASMSIGENGPHTFASTAALVADVQAWLDHPASNFGWLVRGREGVARTSKRFDSRTGPNPPRLTVTFTAPPQPGVLEFSQSSYFIDETSGMANISVLRRIGSAGQVTVSYSSADLTAAAGIDYESASGTLTFGAGVTEQSFEVPILDDAAYEGPETIRLTLSNPGGGASLGDPAQATVTVGDEEDLTEALYFAQFGEGVGFFSQIILLNSGDSPVNGRMLVRRNDGSPLPARLNGALLADGALNVSVPPGGARSFVSSPEGTPEAGSVTVVSDGALVGVILFGGDFGLAGVGASPAFPTGFFGPIETNETTDINTGVAVENVSEANLSLTLELLDEDGVVVSESSLELPPFGHAALFVTQLDWDPAVDFSDRRGALRVASNGPVAATMIQTRPGQFATFPVAPR